MNLIKLFYDHNTFYKYIIGEKVKIKEFKFKILLMVTQQTKCSIQGITATNFQYLNLQFYCFQNSKVKCTTFNKTLAMML